MENKIRMREIESKSDPCSNCKNGPKPGRLCTGCRDFAYACKLHNIDPAALDAVNAGADMAESKSDPCKGCMNGPKPESWCIGCRNFAYGCKIHNIDPTVFNPVKIDMTGATPADTMESKTSRYSEAQKKAVKMHLDFLCKIINYTLHNDIPLEKSKVAFLESIFDNIIRCAESESRAEAALSYTEQD